MMMMMISDDHDVIEILRFKKYEHDEQSYQIMIVIAHQN